MKSNVLVIAASPKGKKGNSESLADYLVKEFHENNVANIKVSLTPIIDIEPKKHKRLLHFSRRFLAL